MDQITPLLHNELTALLFPLLLGIRGLRKKFATSDTLPTISELLITLAMFAVGFGLAYANLGLHPATPAAVADLAWVQGILFGVALMLSDMGFDATSIKTADAQRTITALRSVGPALLLSLLAVVLCTVPRVARATDTPGLLSLERLSAGPRLTAQVYDFDAGGPREIGFSAGAAASWNLTSRWDLGASVERKFNAGTRVPTHWRYSVGPAILLPNSNDRQQWFLAVERAWYSYPDLTTDGRWVVRLQWAFGAQDKSEHDEGFAIVRARYDVEDGRRDVGAGVQPQLIGGR